MGQVEIAIRKKLIGTPEVFALVGDRIYPEIMPEGAAYPAITYAVDEDPDMVLDGMTDVVYVDLELTVWARSSPTRHGYAIARDLASAVRRALLGAPGMVEGVDLMSITGGSIDLAPPDTTTETWQAWVQVHVVARLPAQE